MSTCRVLREQDVPVAARTYRSWRHAQPCSRDVADAYVINAILDACYTWEHGVKQAATPVVLYGRRKMTAHLHRHDVQVTHAQVA